MADGLLFTFHQYGEHELQRLATWEPREPTTDPKARWIIFIHGGAWRDPTNTYADFLPTINALLSSSSKAPPPIRGFASLDYRLSPHPSYPQPPSTPPTKLRAATHPSHVQDVHAALAHLHEKRSIDGYLLVGHSVGATLAFQLLMGTQAAGPVDDDVPRPAGILGVAGIYEFCDFANRNGTPYVTMLEGALGPDQTTWNNAAPRCFTGNYVSDWPSGQHVILADSAEDTLVDGKVETGAMIQRLLTDGRAASGARIHGEHDFAWQDGKEIAGLIARMCQQVG